MKWDYAYSIGELRPDVAFAGAVGARAGRRPYLDEAYQSVWFPPKTGTCGCCATSPNILWERLGG